MPGNVRLPQVTTHQADVPGAARFTVRFGAFTSEPLTERHAVNLRRTIAAGNLRRLPAGLARALAPGGKP